MFSRARRNPTFFIILILLILNSFRSGRYDSFSSFIISIGTTLPGIIIGLTVHEFAHAYTAYRLGDDTPKIQGRVTLNPLAHIDIVGILALVFVGFGWGKPVVVNTYAFRRNRRLKTILVDVAGSISNFITAFLFMGLLMWLASKGIDGTYSSLLLDVLQSVVLINLVLMLFNLLPVPPLDGFGIATELFNLRRFSWWQKFYNNGTIILILLIVFGITSAILTTGISTIYSFLYDFWLNSLY